MAVERREEILLFLKARGKATLSEVAAHLGLSKQGTLRHLESLQADGLLSFTSEVERAGPGRPEHVYKLTAAAAEHFPQAHRRLAGELVQWMGAKELDSFFRSRTERLEAEYRPRLVGLDLEARVRELARIASEQGHMAEVVETADGFAIRQCNCPIADIALAVGHPCRYEAELYRRLLEVEVTRESWIGDSDSACVYAVRRPNTAPHDRPRKEVANARA